MAVNELNCLMSIVERYDSQVKEKGWGRLVTLSHFYKAYEEFLDTIEQIEILGIADDVEVYIRGNKPSQPIKIYSSNTKEITNAKLAVIKGREDDQKNANKYFETNFNNRLLSNSSILEENKIIEKINNLYEKQERIER